MFQPTVHGMCERAAHAWCAAQANNPLYCWQTAAQPTALAARLGAAAQALAGDVAPDGERAARLGLPHVLLVVRVLQAGRAVRCMQYSMLMC